MEIGITRDAALKLLKEYNKEPFHLRHALTVELHHHPIAHCFHLG